MRLGTATRRALFVVFIMLIGACASPPPPEPVEPLPVTPSLPILRAESRPPGAQITIRETGDVFYRGDEMRLPAGRYTLDAKKTGYTTRTKIVNLDRESSEHVILHMGEGFADLLVSSEPEDAEVHIDGREYGRTPTRLENFPEGTHEVALFRDGFFSKQESVTIVAGRAANLNIHLEKIPTSGPLEVRTRPSGGDMYMDGEKVGVGMVRFSDLAFGQYTLRGVLGISAYQRRVGETAFEHSDGGDREIVLPLDQVQRQLDDQWLNERQALQMEQARYLGRRVSHPGGLRVRLTDDGRESLVTDDRLAETLHAFLRVGDRLYLEHGGASWVLWKRHERITQEFRAAVTAFAAGKPHTDTWPADEPFAWHVPADYPCVLSAMAFGMHAPRGGFPLIDLGGEQLPSGGIKVHRTRSDGPITLVIKGGDNITVNHSEATAQPDPGLVLMHLSAKDDPVHLSWGTPPERILAVCDAPADFISNPPGDRTLQVHEKQLVTLLQGRRVQEMVRLSHGPEYPGWEKKVSTPSGPLADQIDLGRDEIGPNSVAGQYERIWLLRYDQESRLTQRQVSVSYQVGGGIKDFTSDHFLRRPSDE